MWVAVIEAQAIVAKDFSAHRACVYLYVALLSGRKGVGGGRRKGVGGRGKEGGGRREGEGGRGKEGGGRREGEGGRGKEGGGRREGEGGRGKEGGGRREGEGGREREVRHIQCLHIHWDHASFFFRTPTVLLAVPH